MTVEIALVYALVVVALVLFMSGRFRVDAVAIAVMVLLMLTRVLDPRAALSGFSNVATVTVAAMFVLSAGLSQTGALEVVAERLGRIAERSYPLALGALMLVVGPVSGFINNTAAVAILIPVAIDMARKAGTSPSRLLMPLSFAAMFGGVSTLIGTSTNLLVNAIAIEEGFEPLGIFEFTPLGAALFVVGFAYMFAVARFIPERRDGGDEGLADRFEVSPYLAEVSVQGEATCIGETLADNALVRDLDLDILALDREGRSISGVDGAVELCAGDVLKVRGTASQIAGITGYEGLALLRPEAEEMVEEAVRSETETLVEIVVAPGAQVSGQTVAQVDFPRRYGAQVLALRQHGQLRQDLSHARLQPGNSLLVKVDVQWIGRFRDQSENFFIASEVTVPEVRRGRIPVAVAIIAAVVGLAAFDVFPIVVTAIAGSVAMVATGVLKAEEAYEAINWRVIFLLAGLIPLGVALGRTGGAELLADNIADGLSGFGAMAVLAGFFLLTQLMTELISNNASAVLMTPIAIRAAEGLGASPRPFLFAVAVAASMSFMTPIGYQTNTMIYGPGHYRFTDYTRIGGPLNLLVLVVSTILIPILWPF